MKGVQVGVSTRPGKDIDPVTLRYSIRPFQIISLFLVNLTSKNLPGNQEKKWAHGKKNELYNPTENQL